MNDNVQGHPGRDRAKAVKGQIIKGTTQFQKDHTRQ
jgi:hypothetical protein